MFIHVIVHLGLNVSSSAHNCGCMVDGGNAMAAIIIITIDSVITECPACNVDQLHHLTYYKVYSI